MKKPHTPTAKQLGAEIKRLEEEYERLDKEREQAIIETARRYYKKMLAILDEIEQSQILKALISQ